ncbi:hypothetical protein AWB71_00151 [Caballeronia peredens]|nr:hypothetical protein AWB71_00151 [Caballeronia peredens]
MKGIIKILALILMLHAFTASAQETVTVYHGVRGDAILVANSNGMILHIVGGSIAKGSSTAADCFAKSVLHAASKSNYFEGVFEPVKNDITDTSVEDIAGKGIGVYIYPNEIRVGGAEIDGICADGVDFSGPYKKISMRDPRFVSIFVYFLGLIDQNAMHLVQLGNIPAAERELGPFVRVLRNFPIQNIEGAEAVKRAEANYSNLSK